MSETASAVQIPVPGQPWPEQGGVYVGARVIDGVVHHRIIPGGTEFDIPASHNNAAERIADKGEINGFSDWQFGDQRDLMLAFVNAPDLFHQSGRESIQITATPYGSGGAWAVYFEDGYVHLYGRSSEFLARPFRSFIP